MSPPPGRHCRPRRATTGGRWTRRRARAIGVYHPRISQRAHEAGGRPAGVRALVLYPLNALAEDQMARLRVALDGDRGPSMAERATGPGNRFWFGRYTGWTPISGRADRDGAEAELRDELTRLSAMAARVRGTDAERFFPRLDGGEMWSRWDMQDAPPDILITNYSMLNIMLMRDIETNIFDMTRTLASGRSRRTSFISSSTSSTPIAGHPALRSATSCGSCMTGSAYIPTIRSCASWRPAHRSARTTLAPRTTCASSSDARGRFDLIRGGARPLAAGCSDAAAESCRAAGRTRPRAAPTDVTLRLQRVDAFAAAAGVAVPDAGLARRAAAWARR